MSEWTGESFLTNSGPLNGPHIPGRFVRSHSPEGSQTDRYRLRCLSRTPECSRPTSAADGSHDDSGRLRQNALAKRSNLDAGDPVLAKLFGRRVDFRLRAGALHEDQLSAVPKQGSGEGEQLPQCADRPSGHLVEGLIEANLLSARSHDGDVLEPEDPNLVVEPGDPTFHRFDEDELDIWPRNREHQSRQPRACADVADSPGTKERCHDHAVEDVARPQTRKFQGPDQPERLAELRQVRGEGTTDIDPVAEQLGCFRRFRFESYRHVSHRSFT
ncbi:hypothetical protein ABIC64_001205 [Plantibacter flavus]